jgi:hypothetical protein
MIYLSIIIAYATIYIENISVFIAYYYVLSILRNYSLNFYRIYPVVFTITIENEKDC